MGFFPSKFQINEANNGVDRRQENVPDRDVKDLFFAILDKNQDKELSVEEFYLLKSWREVSSTFRDIYHRFWSGKESSITQSGGYTSNWQLRNSFIKDKQCKGSTYSLSVKKKPYSICLKSATYKNRPFFEWKSLRQFMNSFE